MNLELVVTCALGLEPLLAEEVTTLGLGTPQAEKGAVSFRGGWLEVWRANLCLRTANRVLVVLGRYDGSSGDALAAGARGLVLDRRRELDGVPLAGLLHPARTLALTASSTLSRERDVRWIALRTKDGLVDAQRERYGRRATVDKDHPQLPLRLFLHQDLATLLLDTSGEPLDHRGYRVRSAQAPIREQLGAALPLAARTYAGWNGQGPVLDPMCGAGTLLIETAWLVLGRAPGHLRTEWAFQRFPGFDRDAFSALRAERLPAPNPDVRLYGVDRDPAAVAAAKANLDRAGLSGRATVTRGDAFEVEPPPGGPGLLVVNPPYGERLGEDDEQWKRLGDLFKQRFAGWRAVVVAGGESQGKTIGLKPKRRIPVRNGPLEAKILVFELY